MDIMDGMDTMDFPFDGRMDRFKDITCCTCYCRRKQQTKPRFCVPFHPSEQQPYKFSALSVLSVDKKWVVKSICVHCVPVH
jgi:hypothetical protein